MVLIVSTVRVVSAVRVLSTVGVVSTIGVVSTVGVVSIYTTQQALTLVTDEYRHMFHHLERR